MPLLNLISRSPIPQCPSVFSHFPGLHGLQKINQQQVALGFDGGGGAGRGRGRGRLVGRGVGGRGGGVGGGVGGGGNGRDDGEQNLVTSGRTCTACWYRWCRIWPIPIQLESALLKTRICF